MKILLNNQIVDEKDAKISALDRGYLMGDGIFSTLTIQDGKILFFEDHIDRLKDGCKKIKIIFPKIDISKIFELISVNNKGKGKFRLRITISRKGKFSARANPKLVWMRSVRAQRKFLKELKDKDLLITGCFWELYRKSKGGFFRSIRHIKLFIKEKGLVKEKWAEPQ